MKTTNASNRPSTIWTPIYPSKNCAFLRRNYTVNTFINKRVIGNDKLIVMVNDDFDIEIFPIIIGFIFSLFMSAVLFVLLLGFAGGSEPKQFQVILTNVIFPLLLISIAGNIMTGYITAKCSTRAPILHALIVAILLMLLAVATRNEPSVTNGYQPILALRQLLAIPLILIGARIAGAPRNSREGELLIRQWQESAEHRKRRKISASPPIEE